MLLAVAACGGDQSSSNADHTSTVNNSTVNVFNWADYIAPGVIEQFESETGIKVNYDVYDAAAMVDVKLLTGNSGYDVVIHSNQYSSRLIGANVYQKLDTTLLPNIVNLDPDIMQAIDIYENVRPYYVPYHWGSTGFTWNYELVRERLPDHPMDSLDVFFDPKIIAKLADCGVTLLDGTTSMIPMAMAYLGIDPNSLDDDSLAAVANHMKSISPHIRYYSNDKYISDLPNKEVCLSMSWSGDYALSTARAAEAGVDIDLRYVVPKEGGPIWIDGIYIPSDAPHVSNAHRFINFLLRADVAAKNTNFNYYANANGASFKLLDDDVLNNPAVYPDAAVWQRLYAIEPTDPVRERPRTRTLARIKSGI